MASSEHDLDDDMGLFEAAVHAETIELEIPELQSIVAVLDGSNQDETVRALTQTIADANKAQTHVLSQTDVQAADVLKACEEQKAQLLVIPVPLGIDIDRLKDESLGDVVDVLLQGLTIPILCARQPMSAEQIAAALQDVLAPILDHEHGHDRAASWAFRLLAENGRLELLGVADRDLLDEARQLLGMEEDSAALRAEALNRAVTRDIGGLVSAVQKQGLERNVPVHVEVKVGRAIPSVLEHANARPRLIVAVTSRDHLALSYHHVVDLLLGADGPVLVV